MSDEINHLLIPSVLILGNNRYSNTVGRVFVPSASALHTEPRPVTVDYDVIL